MAEQRLGTTLERKRWFSSKEFIESFDYDGEDLGAVCKKQSTTFKVWAPTASAITLKLYDYGSRKEATENNSEDRYESTEMKLGEKGVWSARILGDQDGRYYTFLVNTDGIIRESADPYARACGVNGERSMVIDMARTNPEGWESDVRPQGIEKHPVIYELHIKDFSNDIHSGVRPEWRGKYLAFTQQETSYDSQERFPTCLEYLKTLGITYVHLLPAFDFGSVDESISLENQFNWGYDPVNYNVPEGSYATDASDGHVRVREFKEMVQALHRAGMGVIMDVVFNHTYDLENSFQRIVPDYYYRINEDGSYSNGSACGNDTASERTMFRRFMADSVCFWAENYHIDGFRFDLMGLHDTETMNYIRRRLDALPDGEQILMYGEPWAADVTNMENEAVQAVAGNIRLLDSRIAMFNDKMRDGVKGSPFKDKERGYVSAATEEEAQRCMPDIRASVCGGCGDYPEIQAKAPSQIINYVSAHDDRTLWDKLVYSTKEMNYYYNKYEDVLQMNKMAAGIIFTSMGIPFFMAGEEFARTKDGIHNSYNFPPSVNQLDWSRALKYQDLTEYYRFMIALRKELPVLERRDAAAVWELYFFEENDAVIGFRIGDAKHAGKWRQAIVFYNPYTEEKAKELPEGTWHLLTDGTEIMDMEGSMIRENIIILKPRSVSVLGRK